MQKMIRPPKPDWWEDAVKNIEDKKKKVKLITYLAEATQWHSVFTDRLFDLNNCTFYFFNHDIDNIWEWQNVFLIHSLDKISTKDIPSYDTLLRPDAEDYDFDRYFEIDFETGEILPNKTVSNDQQIDAMIQINSFQLNDSLLIMERKAELDKYLSNIKKHSISQKQAEEENNANPINKYLLILESVLADSNKPKNYDELNINNYSFRFYLQKNLDELYKKGFNEYIKSININSYLGIKNLEINNLADKKEIFLLGENGVGKTLVLQAIALASYNLNAKFLYKYLDISDSDKFMIKILDNDANKYYAFPNAEWNKPINSVFAYGISRLNEGKGEENGDENYRNILSIFKRDYRFINPVEWLKEVDYKQLKGIGTLTLKQAKNILTYFLDEEVKIEENTKGDFLFKEKGTTVRHFSQLSDGYRSVLIWISDLLSCLAERNPTISDPKEYKATVMVDEIGEFLHPTWEYGIVRKLRNAFPKIQWIFTTHSPIVVLGASKDAILYKLYKENGITKVSEPYPISAFSNYLIDGFATSPLFDLPTSRPVSFEGDEYELETGNYLYDKIHEEVLKRLKEKPLQNKELKNLINELLDKYEKEGIL